ncbi:MAG: T9SS type A sorting domain-containing protein [Bacteroidales bacterium]|nr:T9SS type A sorting domain-containing protein [Bacteroidales bacterium]
MLSNTIRLGDYADGLYFVRILQNNQIITTEKIVKK